METQSIFKFQGVDGLLELFADRLELTPKSAFRILGGQGNETILIKNVTSVEVRECSFVNGGHIQLSAHGTNEKNNKINFGGLGDRKSMNTNANRMKSLIIEKMQQAQNTDTINPISTSDELLKLSKLKEEGILSDEEFQSAKKKMLGI